MPTVCPYFFLFLVPEQHWGFLLNYFMSSVQYFRVLNLWVMVKFFFQVTNFCAIKPREAATHFSHKAMKWSVKPTTSETFHNLSLSQEEG